MILSAASDNNHVTCISLKTRPLMTGIMSTSWRRSLRYAGRAAIALVLSLLTVLLFARIPAKRNSLEVLSPSELSRGISLDAREGHVHTEACSLSELSGRVLLQLERAEQKETDPWYRDDLRIAWITTLYALRGEPQPHVRATYAVLGVHPDQVFRKITAFRKWVLGAEYSAFFPETSSPKKPVQSVRDEKEKAA